MLRIAQALVALARRDPHSERLVRAAWDACQNLPHEETLTLDFLLLPLARATRVAGYRALANDLFVRSREVVRRRRGGSGDWWLSAIREAPALHKRVS